MCNTWHPLLLRFRRNEDVEKTSKKRKRVNRSGSNKHSPQYTVHTFTKLRTNERHKREIQCKLMRTLSNVVDRKKMRKNTVYYVAVRYNFLISLNLFPETNNRQCERSNPETVSLFIRQDFFYSMNRNALDRNSKVTKIQINSYVNLPN